MSHIKHLNSKLSSGCYAIRVVSDELDKEIARRAYFALIESHLRYGICFWGACSKQLFNSVFLLQKRAVRFMSGAKTRDSCRPLFLRHKILTLTSIFILESACLMHKKHQEDIGRQTVYDTRSVYISLPRPTSSQTHKSIFFGSKRVFNRLPLQLRQIRNERVFRRSLKAQLVVRPYYDLSEFFGEDFD